MFGRSDVFVAWFCLVFVLAGGRVPRRGPAASLLAAPLPDLSRVDAGVQAQVRGPL